MHSRAQFLIDTLGLTPHPEGGFFMRVYQSDRMVTPEDGRGSRRAFSVIYFLLVEGMFSRWHRVLSEEAWHHYEGAPLELFSVAGEGGSVTSHMLGPLNEGSAPLHVIPAGWWQAARTVGPYSLVGCSLGPGFEYDDFSLLSSVAVNLRPTFIPSVLLHAYL